MFLHSLEDFAAPGCGCFQLILFQTDKPRPGIGIMERGSRGAALRQELERAPTQLEAPAPGVTGAAPASVRWAKFPPWQRRLARRGLGGLQKIAALPGGRAPTAAWRRKSASLPSLMERATDRFNPRKGIELCDATWANP